MCIGNKEIINFHTYFIVLVCIYFSLTTDHQSYNWFISICNSENRSKSWDDHHWSLMPCTW